MERDGATCVWCGRQIDTDLVGATTEHVVPRIKGGPSWIENEVVACHRCNGERGHASPAQWVQECERRGWAVNKLAVQRSLASLEKAIVSRGGQRRARVYVASQLRRVGRPHRGGPQTIPVPDSTAPGTPAPWETMPADQRHHDLTRIVANLTSRGPGKVATPDLASPKASAVLIALYEEDGDTRVILTRRSLALRNHTGEVSFPGGRSDSGETPEQTALREAHEEIGLDPGLVSFVGELDHVWTLVSASYIVPKVAVLAARPERLAANPHEVDTILHVSLDELTAPDVHRCEIWSRPPQRYEVNFFFLFGDTVWGATGRILRQLLCVSLGLDDDPDVIER